jgi:hypothetical protein
MWCKNNKIESKTSSKVGNQVLLSAAAFQNPTVSAGKMIHFARSALRQL